MCFDDGGVCVACKTQIFHVVFRENLGSGTGMENGIAIYRGRKKNPIHRISVWMAWIIDRVLMEFLLRFVIGGFSHTITYAINCALFLIH